MTEVTYEQVIAALSERGRLEWELATKAAIITAQRREIEALSISPEPKDDDDK